VSESPLSTHAGPIAVIAGGLFAVAHLGKFLVMDRSNLVTMMLNPAFRLFSAAVAITFPLMVIALVALYWREAQEAGVFGAVAFCIAVTGTVALAGDMWFEGFASPWIARVTPEMFSADRTGSSLVKAWLVTVVLFALGWALFGIASWRARVFPVALSIALGVAGLIGFMAAMPPWGVPLGLAVAALGVWLIRHDRTVGAAPLAATTPH
jgi:hypothetical protein